MNSLQQRFDLRKSEMWINEPRADINVLRKHDKIDKTVEAWKTTFCIYKCHNYE